MRGDRASRFLRTLGCAHVTLEVRQIFPSYSSHGAALSKVATPLLLLDLMGIVLRDFHFRIIHVPKSTWVVPSIQPEARQIEA